jgi:hypothetical protein
MNLAALEVGGEGLHQYLFMCTPYSILFVQEAGMSPSHASVVLDGAFITHHPANQHCRQPHSLHTYYRLYRKQVSETTSSFPHTITPGRERDPYLRTGIVQYFINAPPSLGSPFSSLGSPFSSPLFLPMGVRCRKDLWNHLQRHHPSHSSIHSPNQLSTRTTHPALYSIFTLCILPSSR